MKKKILCSVLVGCTVLTTGCATIVSKSKYPVNVISSPDNATFTVKNSRGNIVAEGITPEVVTLKAGAGYFKPEIYTLTFSKEGYPEKTVELKADFDGWYIGNLVIGGLLGLLIVDPITGAMYKLPPDVTAKLDAPKQGLKLMSIEDLPQEQKGKLIKLEQEK